MQSSERPGASAPPHRAGPAPRPSSDERSAEATSAGQPAGVPSPSDPNSSHPSASHPGRTAPDGTGDGDAAAAERAARLEAAYHGVELPRAETVLEGAPGCQRCEVLPPPLAGPGTLHLRVPHTHTLGKVLAFLVGSGWRYAERLGAVSVRVPGADLGAQLAPLVEVLTSVERRDTRVVFQADGHLMTAEDYFAAEPLPAFQARVESAWLLDLLRGRGLRSVFQPIVPAASVSRAPGAPAARYAVHGYECLLRGVRDGAAVAPGPMFALARAADLVFQLDLAARRTALLAAARHRVAECVFVNFTPHAIYEPKSCLRSTLALVDELGLRREQVVFEVVETERFDDLGLLRRTVDYYRDRGFGVALDDVGAGYASLNALVALRPDYVKLDMALTRGVDQDPTRAVVAAKVLEAAQGLGLRTVVEGVETAAECAWAAAHGADFLQGFYVARPAEPPPRPADARAPLPAAAGRGRRAR